MIWYHQPYRSDKNIGRYYNEVMLGLPSGDWACFTDADAMFTTVNYGTQIEQIIASNLPFSLFYAVTNRIGCRWQQAGGNTWGSDDIAFHREVGAERQAEFGTQVIDVSAKSEGGSGFLILLSRSAWLKAGPFNENRMLGVDWDYFQQAKAAGLRIGLMPGVYLYHWYRGGDSASVAHLK